MVASLNVRVYVACAAALYVKFFLVTGIQGGKTFRSGGRPPEDNRLSLAKGQPKQNYGLTADIKDERVLKARAIEHRWRRIVSNDLESLPFALMIFAGGVLADANETVFAVSMITYTVMRILHTIVYAQEKQPHRAIVWFIAIIMIFTGAANAIVGAFW